MVDASVHDRRKGTIPDPALHRSILQDRSCANVQESAQAAEKMVLGLHYERGLYADGYPAVEEVSFAVHRPLHEQYHSDYRIIVLHHDHLGLHHI